LIITNAKEVFKHICMAKAFIQSEHRYNVALITIKKGNKVLGKVLYCNSLLSRASGLMFRKKQMALIELPFESSTMADIHTLFMRFTLDLYWLDSKMRVISIKKQVKRFCYAHACKKSKYILEAPSGLLKLKLNDRLSTA